MTKTMTMSANQKGLSECRFQRKAVSIHCRFAPISTASLPSDGILSSRRNPRQFMGTLTCGKLAVDFEQTNGCFEQFHVISALSAAFRVFSERFRHSDFVHADFRCIMI